MDRETVPCSWCRAQVGEPCYFGDSPPWTVVEDGEERRVVHAARYARTLPEDARQEFWRNGVDRYLSEQLAALPGEEARADG